MDQTKPTHAATVVLVRERADDFELFMVKRHKKSSFMASAYVYPGGKLDPRDATPETARHCIGATQAEAASRLTPPEGSGLDDDAPLSPGEALGMYVAAIREVFEESGVLLAQDRESGETVAFDTEEREARFEGYRAALHSGELSMTELAEAEDLTYGLDRLHYFAHWITPVVEPRRFNARFFLARAPEGQEPLHDDKESVDSAWLSPSEALALYSEGKIQLAPPTMRTLEDMAAFDGLEALVEGLASSRPVPIMPRFEELEGTLTLLLPGDPLYPSERPVSGPTRVQMSEGRWWSKNASS